MDKIDLNALNIYAIACTGYQGQIGLNGRMPWEHDDSYRNALKYDLSLFSMATARCLMVAGHQTFATMQEPFVKNVNGRILLKPKTPQELKEFLFFMRISDPELFEQYTSNTIWIVGGAKTYTKWQSVTKKVFLSRMEYLGDADRWFPFEDYTSLEPQDFCALNEFTARKLKSKHKTNVKETA